MKFKGLMVNLLSICLGIGIYSYATDVSFVEAGGYMYWCVIGGVFVWVRGWGL